VLVLGSRRAFEMPGSTKIFTVLTVCTGNICRSPFAERYLRAQLDGVPGIDVASAGTMGVDGGVMPSQAEDLLRVRGIDPSGHRARYLQERHVAGAGLVLALAREHRRDVVRLWPRATRYTFTLREFARLSEGLSLSDMRPVHELPTGDVPSRLEALVSLVASRRGIVEPALDPIDDDVIDPYRQDDETYARSAAQLVPAAEITARVLRAAVAGDVAKGAAS
jgi:protein-tyrosine phosphatase